MGSDEELMLEYQRGSGEAFEELFARHRDAIYGFFRRRLCDAGRAEELAQEVFIAVIRGANRYEPRSAFRTYLLGIALNLLHSERRRRKPAETEVTPTRESSAQPPPEETLWVRRAVESLEESQREVLLLREYEQLTYGEIAELLRTPVNTVRSRLFRARMALKDALLAGDAGRSRSAEAL